MGALQLSGENICFVTKYMIVTICSIDLFIENISRACGGWRIVGTLMPGEECRNSGHQLHQGQLLATFIKILTVFSPRAVWWFLTNTMCLNQDLIDIDR